MGESVMGPFRVCFYIRDKYGLSYSLAMKEFIGVLKNSCNRIKITWGVNYSWILASCDGTIIRIGPYEVASSPNFSICMLSEEPEKVVELATKLIAQPEREDDIVVDDIELAL